MGKRWTLILLLITLLCCEFSDELEGPPTNGKNDKKNRDKSLLDGKESEDDLDDSVLKIVPAPDLTQEREKRKGKVTTFWGANNS